MSSDHALQSRTGSALGSGLPYVVAVALAFAIAGAVMLALGVDVSVAYTTIFSTSFRSPAAVVETLHKWVPLTLQALAFTIPLAAGKFNIGGEGQLLLGAIGAAAVGILLPGLPAVVLLPLVLAVGIALGAVWAGIAAWLLVRFGVHEILSTVLLNFASFGLISYVAGDVWSDPAAGHPTTVAVGAGAELPRLLNSPPLHAGTLITLAVVVVAVVVINRTPAGYELRAAGANARASQVHGIRVSRVVFGSLVIGGAVAGLSGAIEVSGVHERLLEGIQSNYLVLGIIVGLLARGNNALVPVVAFLIAVLEVGSSALQRTVNIPAEMVLIVEALILIFVLLADVISARAGRLRWKSS